MPLINVAYNVSFGWTKPQLQSLESQMLEPLLNEHPVEMGLAGRQEAVCMQLDADPDYHAAFTETFPAEGSPVTFDRVVKAIAAFERTLISGESRFDRYVFAGDHSALSAQAKRGMALFYSPRAGCGSCHSGFNFDGNWRDAQGETGRASFAMNGTSDQAMRVPTLRNIAITAPYMHDGRFATLDAVLDHYAAIADQIRTGKVPPHVKVDPRLAGFSLSADERSDLVAFLNTLTDEAFLARYAPR
jgi:cytochrome c peroxidase